jgi:(1->4)-alpha-D-glucan 1-alpha-D-glucosylmutase
VQAKGVEDTAFYRYNTLLPLNEVGGDPSRVGRSPKQFHASVLARASRRPHGMTATATHDTKLGEDTRARLAAISERPDEWQKATARWSRIARAAKTTAYGERVPDRNDEYRFYQVLAGVWPAEALDAPLPGSVTGDLVERLQQYMDKATREAKLHTSWINPNETYDRATKQFVHELLAGSAAPRFLAQFVPFARSLARAGAANSLSQLLVKVASPGVPDFYQGTELWDLTLVDPDNRRPIDFDLRCRLARELDALVGEARAARQEAAPKAAQLLAHWHDGRIKLFATLASLALRRERPDLFLEGQYVPLATTLPKGADALAFARVLDDCVAIAIAPTLTRAIAGEQFALGDAWNDGTVDLPASAAGRSLINVLTGERLEASCVEDGAPCLRMSDALRTLPIALLTAAPAPKGSNVSSA